MAVEDLAQLAKDRFTPAELVEVLDIDIDDLVSYLYEYIELHVDKLNEEMREYFDDF